MFNVFILCVLLLYFWYFYYSNPPSVPKPASGSPTPAPYDARLMKESDNTMQIFVNNAVVWEHTLPEDLYLFRKGTYDVIPKDNCYYVPSNKSIPATGRVLYDYLKRFPDFKTPSLFQEDSPHTVQEGNVFYFNCSNKQIQSVGICPSGTVFQRSKCIPVSSCTDMPDNTYFPDPNRPSHYIQCKNGREFEKYCGNDYFFYHDRCVAKDDLVHVCRFDTSGKPRKLDNMTLFTCVNGRPEYWRCAPGTQMFEHDYCEPADCVGKPDGATLPLPRIHLEPFSFVPGYNVCFQGKVYRTEHCPQQWDDSKGDNLTHLPMVFDGSRCSVPTLCDNVEPDDDLVIVPVHEFTKHVRNWKFSELYDTAAGYVCEGGRKRLIELPPDKRISKRFKIEDGCGSRLPMRGRPHEYYDCHLRSVVSCPDGEHFDGEACVRTPENAFTYQGVPLFNFESSLNFESWITPWEYKKGPFQDCRDPESAYVPLYDICSHPDCVPYAFVSMIPDLPILLPDGQSKCQMDGSRLKKEAAPNRAWQLPDPCVPGQKLKTGHFVWDSTVFATCDETQPFVFCPSSRELVLVADKTYACKPPDTHIAELHRTHEFIPFAQGEVRKVLPIDWDGTQGFKRNRRMTQYEALPEDGYVVDPGERFTLAVNKPVKLELRFRVTHPPNVAFRYDPQESVVVAASTHGFVVRNEGFTAKPLTFPTYKPQAYVKDFLP